MALMTHGSTSSTTVHTLCSSASLSAGTMPPPTCNHLDAAQRSRLIKSTRKLGKVLGTTPYVLESPLPPLPSSPSTGSVKDVARKRYSMPPTPTSTYGEFKSESGSDASSSRTRKVSLVSTLSDGESESNTSHPYLAEHSTNTSQHRKASSDGLAPLPGFPGSDSGRHKSKRPQHFQPVLRLPPASSCMNKDLPSPLPESPFPSDYKRDSENRADLATSVSPKLSTSPVSPSSEMPPTPPSALVDPVGNASVALPDDVLSYTGIGAMSNTIVDESRLRKRRMEKLMRHLGECVPSELVFGNSRPREATSISICSPPMSPTTQDSRNSGLGKTKDSQSRVMRRVSVISGYRRRDPDRAFVEEDQTTSFDCLSEPEHGTTGRIHAVLMREKNKIHVARGDRREKERQLVEDDWTPEAYEDVVKRLRRLK